MSAVRRFAGGESERFMSLRGAVKGDAAIPWRTQAYL
jgi:hypothetical protein